MLNCNQGAKQAAEKETSSGVASKQVTNVNFHQDRERLGLRLSTFDVDATPPVGDPLCYGTATNIWDLGLRAKGIVLLGAGQPVSS